MIKSDENIFKGIIKRNINLTTAATKEQTPQHETDVENPHLLLVVVSTKCEKQWAPAAAENAHWAILQRDKNTLSTAGSVLFC